MTNTPLLIKTSIIYVNCRKPYKIPFGFVVDAAVGIAIVYSYWLGYLSKHGIVPILSCYSHREFLTLVVMALLAMPPHYRIWRLLSVFVLMLSPSRICIPRCFPVIHSSPSQIFATHTSCNVVHPILVTGTLLFLMICSWFGGTEYLNYDYVTSES